MQVAVLFDRWAALVEEVPVDALLRRRSTESGFFHDSLLLSTPSRHHPQVAVLFDRWAALVEDSPGEKVHAPFVSHLQQAGFLEVGFACIARVTSRVASALPEQEAFLLTRTAPNWWQRTRVLLFKLPVAGADSERTDRCSPVCVLASLCRVPRRWLVQEYAFRASADGNEMARTVGLEPSVLHSASLFLLSPPCSS